MDLQANWIDWGVIPVYLIGVFAFGLYMSRREKTSTDFFLAGRKLPWYAISLSLFATNISSGSFLGLAGDAYRNGLAVGTLEWGAILGLILLAFVFLPYYQKRSVYTMPEFMEHRYNLPVRLLFSGAVLIFEILINIPFLLFAGGLAIEVMFNIDRTWAIIAIAIFVATYTTIGGLGAVVWTDVIQGCFMIAGGAVVTIYGLYAIGGIDELMNQAADKMHVCLPADHPEYPFPATMIGGYFLVTIYYWCQNQTMVQRTLGARTEWDARMGTIAACFIKLLLPFIIVLPGIIAFVHFPDLESADKALPTLIKTVVPVGVSGLMIAAVIASLMSSADSALNAWATMFTYDFYRRLFDRNASQARLIAVGRLTIIFVIVATVIRTLLLKDTASILQFLLNGLAYISCPIVVIFLVGILWSRATSAAALATMITSPITCYYTQNMKTTFGWGFDQTSIVYWLPVAVGVSILVLIIVSLCSKPKSPEQLDGLIWKPADTLAFGTHLLIRLDTENDGKIVAENKRLAFWKDYRLFAGIVFLLMIVIIWLLR